MTVCLCMTTYKKKLDPMSHESHGAVFKSSYTREIPGLLRCGDIKCVTLGVVG